MDSSSMIDRLKYVGNYQLEKTLGEGTFGKVKLGTHLLTSEKVAVKILDKERLVDPQDRERLSREIRIMKMLNSPHIIRLYEVIDTSKHIFLILENAPGGELFDYIVAHERVKEKEARKFFRQLVSGIDYCHQRNIIHRDLKPENLLLDADNNIKIVDFGFSNQVNAGQLLKTFCGSPAYAAPEMISGREYIGPEVDMWSLGVILFALLCGYLPFDNSNVSRLYQQVLKGDYHIPEFVSQDAKNLISRLLVLNPEKRATMDEVRLHAWVNQGYSGPPEAAPLGSDSIDMSIVNELGTVGFDPNYAMKSLKEGERNQVTATYWLLFDKKRKEIQKLHNQGVAYVDDVSPTAANGRSLSPIPDNPSSPTQRFSGDWSKDDYARESSGKLPLIRERKGSILKSPVTVASDENMPMPSPLHKRAMLQAKTQINSPEVGKERSNSFRRRRNSTAITMLEGEDCSSPKLAPLQSSGGHSPIGPDSPGVFSPLASSPQFANLGNLPDFSSSPRAQDLPIPPVARRMSLDPSALGSILNGNRDKPQLAPVSELREARGVFNVSTTSSKPVKAVLEEVKRVLNSNNVTFRENGCVVFAISSNLPIQDINILSIEIFFDFFSLSIPFIFVDTW
eukprot:TRINITY_DN4978_c0_g3_i1.p1 TRINITY_DN4978_c0_g3~~TRINITY_DN4978_c0_g3_i1.p1  ORF type:complete len:623 (-),score=138.79 TRINITY_DN4978_c0_g3_i1:916-2784(-)